jgi:hypothetical protein
MKLKITNSSLFTKNFLTVDSHGVKFYDGTGFSGAKRFRFHQIECVLLSPDHKLSFQVGQEVFSIPVKPDNAKHRAVMEALVQQVQNSLTGQAATG